MNSPTKRGLLSRLKSQFNCQRFNFTKTKGAVQGELSPHYSACQGLIDMSKWKKLDARKLGITGSMISSPSWTVLNLLRHKGFNTYLVGGCVRDLLLNRIPKDFDVITTAKLIEVQRHFRRVAHVDIVGRRFPICRVHIRGSVVEVSSFETVGENADEKEHFLYSLMPRACKKIDLILCEDSLRRDFTINSLFFDPFVNRIYDYATGMTDLRSMKLQTVIPAQLSFEEDPGRILRGVRIAARLGLSLSQEIDAAIPSFSSLVKNMDKTRIMLELNYMLSYGAAEPSLYLLWKFNLLEVFFPLHAAYLDQQATKQDAQTSMLMKLFFHLDKLTAPDRPSDHTIWVGLLAFHLALVKKPQDALVLWAFASVLYYGHWEKGIKFAKEHAEMNVNYVPELRRSCIYKSDKEIAKAVSDFAVLVKKSISSLVKKDILSQSISRLASLTCSGMVYVSRKTGKSVAQIFEVLVNDIMSYKSKRGSFEINYDKLRRGDLSEIRFVLGKVVLETMSSGFVGDREVFETKKCDPMIEGTEEACQPQLSDPVNHQPVAKKNKTSSNLDAEDKQRKIKTQKWDPMIERTEETCQLQHSDPVNNQPVAKKRKTNSNLGAEHRKKKIKTQKCDPMVERTEETCQQQLSDPVNHQPVAKKKKTGSNLDSEHKQKKIETQKLVENRCIPELKMGKVGGKLVPFQLPEEKNFHQQLRQTAVVSENTLDHATYLNIFQRETCRPVQCTAPENHQEMVKVLGNSNIYADAETTKESVLKKKILHSNEVFKERGKKGQFRSKQSRPSLSSLFK